MNYRGQLIELPQNRVKKSVIKGIVEREDETFFTGVVTAGACVLRTDKSALELETFGKFFAPAGLGEYQIEATEAVYLPECISPATDRRVGGPENEL